MLQSFLFQINAVLLNVLFIKETFDLYLAFKDHTIINGDIKTHFRQKIKKCALWIKKYFK